jgi:hypothetical protein
MEAANSLVVASEISKYPPAGSIIVSASRECVLQVKGPNRSMQIMTQGSESTILGGNHPYF